MKKKIIVLLLLLVAATSLEAQDLQILARDHYVGKTVIARMPFPDDKSIMVLYPEKENLFDKELYRLKMERVGVGLEPGDLAIIKSVEVDGTDVTFHFIGAGDILPNGKIPPEMLDKDVWGNGGAKLKIKGGATLKNSNSKLTTINKFLSIVCETKALTSADSLPKAMQAAIKAGVVETGMPKKAVYLMLGDPTDVIKELKGDLLREAWIYEKEDFSTLMIIFHDGKVYLIKEV